MRAHWGAGIVGRLTRGLPARRWQTAHWLGKVFVPRRPFVGRFHGGLLEVHPGEVASMGAFFTGFYEREITSWSFQQIGQFPPSMVIDVGANSGYYPLLFGLLSGGLTESIAFEPDPANFAWLCRNLALNPGLKVMPVQMAVGDVDGEVVAFETAKEGCNLWAHVREARTDEGDSTTINVPMTTLDGYLDRQDITKVPLTIIDVEGHESRVVAGMSSGIASRRYAAVVIEFHPWAFPDPPAEIERIANRFLAAGYSGYRFRHYTAQHNDKDAAYYRLRWDDSLLAPLSFDDLTSWEHYLFVVE